MPNVLRCMAFAVCVLFLAAAGIAPSPKEQNILLICSLAALGLTAWLMKMRNGAFSPYKFPPIVPYLMIRKQQTY